ncbi:hypothetical protein SASPL_139956 [Salvia splendens]|uniref:Autophagy-related protein 101 n=1 Tax=Salvia splendens TaxID=180675 RepID=A0A8X8WPW9_SALSN|nr:hypothetical protein SASPL_139956 [Salvia splendens]
MNCEICQLKELDVEHFEIREVLRCILHTILFHRALGLVRPKDIDLELFEITYVQCGDVELERKTDEKIEQFIDRAEKHPNKKNQIMPCDTLNLLVGLISFMGSSRGVLTSLLSHHSLLCSTRGVSTLICLSFYEVKNKQPTWFTNKVERLYWEQWYINLNVAQHQKGHSGKSTSSKIVVDPGAEERTARRAALEASLRDVLFQIIRFVNEKKDHIPPVPNLEGVSFPYEITISRFCIWNGNVQEDAPNRESYDAQLTREVL